MASVAVLKVTYQSEVRRCLLASVRPSFEEITESIAKLFPEAKECTARYLDEDGDACTLCEASLSDFLAQAANGVDMANSTGKMVLRLELVSLPQAAQAPALPEALPPKEAPEASSAPKDVLLEGSETFPASDSPSDVVQVPEHSKDPKEMPGWNIVDVPEANEDDGMPAQTSNSEPTVEVPDSMSTPVQYSQVTQEAFEGSQNDSAPKPTCEASNSATPLPSNSGEALNGEQASCSKGKGYKGKGYKGKGKGKGMLGWKGHWCGHESQQEHPWQSWWKCHLGWCEPEDADMSHHGGVACEDPPEDARLCGKSEGCKGKGKFKGKAGKCGGKGKLWWQGYCPDEEQEQPWWLQWHGFPQWHQTDAPEWVAPSPQVLAEQFLQALPHLTAKVCEEEVLEAWSQRLCTSLDSWPAAGDALQELWSILGQHKLQAEQQLARFLEEVTQESASQFLLAFLSELEALDEEQKLSVMASFFESQEERLQKIFPQLPRFFLLGMLGKGGKWGKGAKGKAKGKCWLRSQMARDADETVPMSTTDDQHSQPAHDPSWNRFLYLPKDPNYVPYVARKGKSSSLAELAVAAGAVDTEPASSSDGQPVDDPSWNSFLNLPKDPNYKSYVARKMEEYASKKQKLQSRFETEQT